MTRESRTAPHATLGGLLPLAGSITSICVGSSIGKTLFPLVGAPGTTALRNGLAALLMVVVARPWRWRLDRERLRVALAYGVILGAMNLSFYSALARLPVGIAIAVEFLGPLGVAVWLSPRRRDLVWIACAAGGIALLNWPGAGAARPDPVGVALALVAAACWAAYIVVGARASRLLAPVQAVTLGFVTAACLTVPIGVVVAGPTLAAPHVLAIGALVALLSSAIPYPLEMLALRRLPRHVFGVVLSAEPAAGALAGWAVLGERLSLVAWIAIALVVVASVGITLSRPAETAEAQPGQ